MDSMKLKNLDQRVENLEKRFKAKYRTPFIVWGKQCFTANENEFFRISRLSWLNAIVVEHAFSEAEAKKNMFEDGDLFYMDELTEDEMFNEMIKEIEDSE